MKENMLRCGNPSTARPSFPQTTSTTFIHVSGAHWAWTVDFCQLCLFYVWRALEIDQ